MQLQPMKRSICLLLALVMVFSMLPLQGFAAGTEDHIHAAASAAEPTDLELTELHTQADEILAEYLGSAAMPQEQIPEAAAALDPDTIRTARTEIEFLAEQLALLTEDQLLAFGAENPAFVTFADRVMSDEIWGDYALMPLATSGTVLSGQITVTDTASKVTVSGNNVTATVKGSGGLTGGSTATNTITISNTSGSTAVVSFDYSCSATGTFTFSESSNSGSFSGMLAAGESITMTMTATGGALWSSSTATLKLTNFTLTKAQDSSRVTVNFDSTRGSVTADGAAVSAGDTLEGVTPAEGVQLKATAAKGYTFACWLDPDSGTIAAYEPTYQLQPLGDATVEAVFIPTGGNACFRIGRTLYYSLNDALAAAVSGDVIILVSNGTLPAGDYTIPGGITLLIPLDENGTVFTTAPESTSATTTPSAYRTLTLAKGAHLTVNGTLSVTAKHNRNSGRPVGKYGYMVLNEGSDIKVNGKLYAYGFIGGKGSVKIMSGATVYEYFQIIDFRGGTATLGMYGNNKEVFPLSQYYVQNVEAPMTLEAGATEYGYTTLYMSSTEYHSSVKFIGTSSAMFNLSSGSVTKEYDGTTDRLHIKANGTMSLEPMSLSVSTMSINSSDYVLPLNSSITIELEGGTATVKQDLALQPSAQLIVGQGATCKLGSGVRIYVYDQDQWGSYVYSGAQLRVVPYAPGRTYKSATSSSRTINGDAGIQVAGTLDASAGKLYTTESGAAITGVEGGIVKMASVSSGSTYQATQSGTSVSYDTIAVTSAKLQNANGEYLSTSANTYCYEGGVWGIYCAHSYTASTTAPTCTADGSTTYTCGKCGRSYSEVIPATGHTAGAAVTENSLAATCTENGGYDTVVYCTVCGVELSRAHTTVAATGHSWNEGEITTAPGCLTEGEKTYTCSACGEKQTEAVPALGHDMVYTPNRDATCTEPGESASAYCSRCDYVEASGGVIPALGHDWSEASRTEATCTADGRIVYVCARCGEDRTDPIEALGHAYESVVTAPTCTAPGSTTHTCSRCGHSYVGEQTPPAGHRYEEAVTDPTCTAEGYTTYTCTVCGESHVDDIVPATGHSYGDGSVTRIATCTESGVRTYTCALCGDSYDVQIPALGHDLTHHDTKLASYTSVGWDAYDECARCDYTTYHEYPMLKRQGVSDYETFLVDLRLLEQIADRYADENPGADPAALVLNYIRCGIASYTTTSWAIMAGNENTDFTAYVLAYEDAYNAMQTDPAELISVVSIRDLKQFAAPSDPSFALEFTHMFGTMDITGHNPGSRDHADVAGWAGDLVDLLDLVDNKSDVTKLQTVEEMVTAIFAGDYLAGAVESFGRQDMYGDLDAFYIMQELQKQDYHTGLLTEILEGYFVEGLTDEDRAAYFLENRMGGITNRRALRNAVYEAYVGNRVNTTLEGTRTFVSGSEKLYDLRMACCYAFADYLWQLAGDYVPEGGASLEITESVSVTLAPGITRQTAAATAADGERIHYYVTTAELGTGHVRIDASVGTGTVLAQAEGYGANVIAAVNAGSTAAGSWSDSTGFAGMLTGRELVREGRSVAADSGERTAATAAGITKTGKAVLVTVDSATEQELARILLDAGCVSGYLLDSGADTAYVSRMETEDAFTDHTNNTAEAGSVLLMISTAPDNTVFDHAILRAEYTYLSVHSGVQITATGVTARGDETAIPEGTLTWSVSDEGVGRISDDGLFTAVAAGDVEVILNLNGEQIGSLVLHVVIPDALYFTTSNINAYFGEAAALPLAALYQRKHVAIAPGDVSFQVSANDEGISGGVVQGFDFIGDEESGLKTITVTAALRANSGVADTITVTMYNPGDVVFDFDGATGGNRELAWLREVSNAATEDQNTYYVVDPKAPMVTDYTFAIDMSAIAVPERLKELTNMLPGADQTDGTAWGFLLQLADRVSVLSEVSAAIRVDPNFDVDLSGLSLQNEYFQLSDARLDPETNLLHVKLNWVKQSAAIEPATANPICVVSGIKLTPKADAAWDDSSTLTPVNSAELSYTFYLSAGALYTFAGDPANQAAYGLAPYINPNNSSDRGASFGDVYASFSDSYTLVNALKNGWYFEEGKNVFYVDGVLHTQHTPGDSVTTAPGCTEGGYTSHVCAICGVAYVSDETEALGHDYAGVVTAPTCTEEGYTTYTCTACGDSYVADVTAALGHTAGEPVKEKEVAPGCTEEGSYESVTYCTVCSAEISRQTITVPSLGHDYDAEVTAPTCTEEGYTTYTCTACGDSYVDDVTAALGHTAGAPVKEKEVAPTCTEEGSYESATYCTVCSAEVSRQTITVPSLGHDYDAEVTVPTCTEEGYTTYTCTACGDSYVDDVTAALGHTAGEAVKEKEVAPTCTEEGSYESVTYCTVCAAEVSRQTITVPSLGHDYDAEVTAPTCTKEGYTTYTCTACGDSYVDDVTAVLGHTAGEAVKEKEVAPNCTEEGFYESVTCCAICSEELSRETVAVPALGHDWADGTCTRCGEKQEQPAVNPFVDVAQTDYFYKAVLWAVEKNVTAGVDATHFGPHEACSRAQVVTFLWRAAGRPQPTTDYNPFADVKETDFFYTAVLWAVEEKITAGVSSDMFGPDLPCTRAQVVTFLWRAMDRPGHSASVSPFADVRDPNAYYYNAVLWAVEQRITAGMGDGTFGIDLTCTRAQTVSFLYRTLK